jgi:hypothetical protein
MKKTASAIALASSIVILIVYFESSVPTRPAANNSRNETLVADTLLAKDLKELCQCLEQFGPPAPVLDPVILPVDVSLENNTKCKYGAQCPDPNGCCQPCFNCYGWQLFIALSWPSKSAGEPDPAKSFGDAGDYSPVVWQSYKDALEVFNGNEPTPWGTDQQLDLQLNSAVIRETLLRSDLQSDHNWLTDQDGEVVRYEIRMNKDEFEYILKNELWHRDGIQKFVTTGGGIELPAQKSSFGHVGAIEVKAAWRIIPEIRRAYFEENYKVAHAKVFDAATRSWNDHDVALVGLHIIKKTPNSPQWVWATFEHKDNAPVEGDPGKGKIWNFFNPDAPSGYTPNYSAPPKRPTPKDKPVQIVRVKQGQDDVDAAPINAAVHALIEAKFPKSVWRNYDLISVQWPRNPVSPRPNPKIQKVLPAGLPLPRVLANTSMESYVQLGNTGGGAGVGPGASRDQGPDTDVAAADKGKSSCIGCHRISAVTPFFDPTTKKRWPTDYSTIFYKATKKR